MLFDASKTSIRKTNKSVYVITVLDCTERPLYVRSEPVVSRQTQSITHGSTSSQHLIMNWNGLQRFQLLSVLATNYVFFVTDADLQIVMLIIILGVKINCFYGGNCFTA